MSLFRQEERIGSLSALPFYMSGGSKHQQNRVAKLTLPLLVLGTFKLWLCVRTAGVSESEMLSRAETDTGSRSVKGLTWLAGACEAIDQILTDAVIHAWVTLTVIHIDLTVGPHVSWKTEVQRELIILQLKENHHVEPGLYVFFAVRKEYVGNVSRGKPQCSLDTGL